MNVLVTGATGNIGGRVAKRLIARGLDPLLLARNVNRAKTLFSEHARIAEGDLKDEQTLSRAIRAIDALFLVGTGPELAAHDRLAARVASASGIQRVVKLSSLDAASPDVSDLADGVRMGSWHAAGELAIRESGASWCFLRPTGFMSNALAWVPSIKRDSTVRAPTGNGRIAMVHPDDVADVAVKALLEPSFARQTLTLTGPVALNYPQMIDILSRASRRTISFQTISDEEAHARLVGASVNEQVANALVALWRDVRLGKSELVTDTVERTLGRPARSFEDWASENAIAFE